MPRLRNFFINPYVILRRDESVSGDYGSVGSQPAPAREMEVHVAGLACTSI